MEEENEEEVQINTGMFISSLIRTFFAWFSFSAGKKPRIFLRRAGMHVSRLCAFSTKQHLPPDRISDTRGRMCGFVFFLSEEEKIWHAEEMWKVSRHFRGLDPRGFLEDEENGKKPEMPVKKPGRRKKEETRRSGVWCCFSPLAKIQMDHTLSLARDGPMGGIL